jgi:uncharacterized membrane protein YidH (DUF202 family)
MAARMGGTAAHSPVMEERDPGLARERTELAWTRSAISFGAVGAAILKTSPAAGAIVLAMSAAIWGLGRIAARNGRDTRAVSSASRQRTLRLIATATTAVALAALAVALLSRSPPPG